MTIDLAHDKARIANDLDERIRRATQGDEISKDVRADQNDEDDAADR